MLSFSESSQHDYIAFARKLYKESTAMSSHEAISQYITESLYHEFSPEMALVRIFRLCHVKELTAELRALVSDDESYVMVLTGTYGMEPAWCDRRQSANHKVISINDITVSSQIPMFEEILINGMKVDLQQLYETGDVIASTKGMAGIFHVPDVKNSPQHIPAQEEFVQPYGITSEVGFGGIIFGGEGASSISLYTLFAFSRVPISDQAAASFCDMRSEIGTALAQRSHQTLFIDG